MGGVGVGGSVGEEDGFSPLPGSSTSIAIVVLFIFLSDRESREVRGDLD